MNSDNENKRDSSSGRAFGKRTLVYLGALVLLFALFLIINTSDASAAGPTYVYEDISTDTTWTEDGSPYILNASISVLPGATLTIEPNVTVMADPLCALEIKGELVAIGTPDEPILLTANGSWYWWGIVIDDAGSAVFSNVIIEFAYYGIYIEDAASAAISDTLIQECFVAGIWWSSSEGIDVEMSGVEIDHVYQETGIMLLANDGNVTVSLTDCTVNDTYGPGIVVQATGWIDAAISGTTVIGSVANSGIILYSTGGDVGATLNSVNVDSCHLNGVLIYSAAGGVDVQVNGSVISSNGEAGLQAEGSADAILNIENSEFSGNLVGVAVYAVDGDVALQLSDVSILDNLEYGLIANSASGNVDLSLTSVIINNLDLTVGVFAKSNEADVNAVIQETSITGGVNGLHLESGGNVSATITDSQLIANRFVSIAVMAYGTTTIAIEQSYMNGEEANEFAWYYPEEIDYEYDIIYPDGYTQDWYLHVSLPFAFPFGTGTYTDLYIYRNGFISVGGPYSGSFPINLDYVSANLIIPCQDYFYAINWPFVSYKIVGDEKIIVQWYVYRTYDPGYVTNVFQAILYSNGDIQFNYANMDALNSDSYSNHYGVRAGSSVEIVLNDQWIPNVYNADKRSIYLARETFANYAVIVESNAGIEATIVDSTISHYGAAGAIFWCGNGNVKVDAVNLTAEYILGIDLYGVALGAFTDNGTMDVMVTESMFSHIGFVALGFVSDPEWGGEDTVEITENAFDEVYWSVVVVTDVYDNDGFNEMVEFSATRTISGNVGTNSGGMMLGTWIQSMDSMWDVSITDTIVNNIFSVKPINYAGLLYFGEPFIFVRHYIYSDATDMAVELNTEITGNSIPVVGMYCIVVDEEVEAYAGRATVISNAVISENTISAPLDIWVYGACIGVYYEADSDTGIDSVIDVSVTDNEMLLDEYLSMYTWAIYVEIGQYLENGIGDGSLSANVVIDRNVIHNSGYGVYLEVWAATFNHFGNQTADVTASVADNEIMGAYYDAIDVYLGASAQYSNYYPPYGVEVSSTQSMTFDVSITGNRVPYFEDWGIGVYTEVYASNWMSIFSHPAAYLDGTVSITDNTVEVSYGAEPEAAIWLENYAYADYGDSIAVSSIETSIANNVINAQEDSYLGAGIYVYEVVEAYTEAYQFSMSPCAILNSDLLISENEINGPVYSGIYIESYAYSYWGMSFVNYQATQEISDNVIAGYDNSGIYAYYDIEAYQYSYNAFETNATVDAAIALIIDDNILSSEVVDYGCAVEIEAYAWSNWGIENYINPNITVEVSSNEISFGPDAWWNEGIYVYCWPAGLVSVVADGNVIENAGVGIDTEYCTVTITNNVISNPGDEGIYLYESTGSVSGNEITGGINAQGIYLDGCFQMNISDNMVDGCGDGIYVYYSNDLVISNNTLTRNGLEGYDTFGLYIYDSYNATITGNTITGNAVGAVIYYSFEITFSSNVISNNLYDGVYFYECESLVVESNIVDENGGNGLEISDCYSVVVGNNTIRENLLYGLNIEYSWLVIIYNGIYQDNTYDGIYASGVVEWIVDDVSEVRNNAITLYGDLTVVDGGMLTLDNVWYFTLGGDWTDGIPQITVEEGGTLVVVASGIGSYGWWPEPGIRQGGYYYSFEVYGTLDMESSEVSGATEIYLGPTSHADIRTSVVYDNWRNGIHVDNCSPRISATTIIYNGMDGIFIEGADAAPTIMDCLIAMNNRGIYAIDSSLANVVDNVILANWGVGIYVIGASGSIHDNILLFNPVEIYVKDSTVTVEDNQIGYSVIIDIMSKYAPALIGEGSIPLFGELLLTPEMIAEAQMNHIGVYAVNSSVSLTDNVYGMLKYAIYATQSTLTVSDTIDMTTLVLPYYDDDGTLWNVSLPIIVYDGIYAAKSTVTVNGGMISVLDDAIFLESSTADLMNVVLDAGDFDIYLTGGSIASAIEVTFEKAKVLDTSVLTVYYKLTVRALDQDGLPVSGVWVVVYDEEGSPVGEGATDENGLFSVYAAGWVQTSAGQSAARTYTVNASFEQGYVEKNVTLDKATEVVVEVPVEKPVAWNPSFAITFTLIAAFLVAVALIIVGTKK